MSTSAESLRHAHLVMLQSQILTAHNKTVKGQRRTATNTTAKSERVVGKMNATLEVPNSNPPNATATAAPSCLSCQTKITDDIRSLQCDACGADEPWKCAKCLNLTSELYDQLQQGSELKWLYTKCDSKVANSGDDQLQDRNATQLENIASTLQ